MLSIYFLFIAKIRKTNSIKQLIHLLLSTMFGYGLKNMAHYCSRKAHPADDKPWPAKVFYIYIYNIFTFKDMCSCSST